MGITRPSPNPLFLQTAVSQTSDNSSALPQPALIKENSLFVQVQLTILVSDQGPESDGARRGQEDHEAGEGHGRLLGHGPEAARRRPREALDGLDGEVGWIQFTSIMHCLTDNPGHFLTAS